MAFDGLINQAALTSVNGMPGMGSTTNPLTAGQTLAQLTRQQFFDWFTDFKPYEDELIEYATDPTLAGKAMTEAGATVNARFDTLAGSQERRLRGMGMTLNADEQKASDRLMSLSRSVADVDAQNRARDATLARQRAILGNPTPTLNMGGA